MTSDRSFDSRPIGRRPCHAHSTASSPSLFDPDNRPGAPVGPPGSTGLTLEGPYRGTPRLWTAQLDLPERALTYLARHGRPIRCGHVPGDWPLPSYQNVYVTEPGSAEMPSAGRPFTPEAITRLVAKGVSVTPVVLHTGVASLQADELPYPERVRISGPTASRINGTRRAGERVVAVGTTVVRAIESAAYEDGTVHAVDGWTDLVVTPGRGVTAVDGLLTGRHEPASSHLLMLEALAGRAALERSYAAALAEGYRFHEFGDVHLLLSERRAVGVTVPGARPSVPLAVSRRGRTA